jgi:hypothetical protein
LELSGGGALFGTKTDTWGAMIDESEMRNCLLNGDLEKNLKKGSECPCYSAGNRDDSSSSLTINR